MPTEFQMPKLGLTMEEGTIIDWLVDDGEQITAGAPVLVIETDKTETEVEAVVSGTLQRAADVGETFRCGETIGWVYADGEAVAAAPGSPSASDRPAASAPQPAAGPAVAPPSPTPAATPLSVAANGRVLASPNARRVAAERGVDITAVRGTGPGGRITSEDVVDVAEGRVDLVAPPVASVEALAPPTGPGVAGAPTPGRLVPATAAARQLADLLGVDLAMVPVDPTDGRVTREAVAAHVRTLLAGPATGAAESAAPPTGGAAPTGQTPAETIRLAGMRGTIAKRMFSSLHEMAQLTLTMDADMDAVVAHRAARAAAGTAPGFTDYVIAAAARALRSHPRVNAQVTDDGIAVLPKVHVGLAVALDEGLIVPVIRDADGLALDDLAAESTRLAEGARAGTLGPDDVQGGTFSVTALGMFGVDAFTPVINPPNAAILGVGRLRDDVVVVDGQVMTTKRLTLSLTWDHRVFDGAPAAEFTRAICELLADPSRLA